MIDYYESFAIHLHDLTCLPVVGLSHTGHLNTDNSTHNKTWKSADLDQQVDDKIKYIEKKLLKSDSKRLDIVLIGHSIGCYVILKMLAVIKERNLNVNIKKSILIFPTIERMSQSPQGKVVTPALNYFLRLILLLVFLVSCIPKQILEKLVRFVFEFRKKKHHVDQNVVHTSLQMVSSYSCVKSLLLMAKHEMKVVDKLNIEDIRNHHKDIILYYGLKDNWCPMDYYHDMTQHFETHLPEFDYSTSLILDKNDLEHAFLVNVKQTEIMSRITAKWIKNCI